MSKLTDRLRGIVGTPGAQTPRDSLSSVVSGLSRTRSDVEQVLGGERRDYEGGSCFVVERRLDRSAAYGLQAVEQIAACLAEASAEASTIAGAPARPPFVFFDLETTGLSGGAGTYAFLVGCGWFEAECGFVTRQFFLSRFADERQMLSAVATELGRAGALVSFNGRSFDAPLLETRYLFHRLDWSSGRLPHVDVLHPARRFWGDSASCALVALEEQILGARRTGDVPGFEIPARYFQFVRSGDARPLIAVFEHNRLDLLSLAGLTARLLLLVRSGPGAARDAREALALGRIYAQAGFEERSLDAFERAVTMGQMSVEVRIQALRLLAVALRRTRRFDEAAARWQQLLDVRGCPPHVAREANEALAIHHEHRVRDLVVAKAFALRSLEKELQPAWKQAVRHRLARLERKLEKTTGAAERNDRRAIFELGE